jgi:hypothetical protein
VPARVSWERCLFGEDGSLADCLTIRAALLHRAGRHAGALSQLRRSMKLRPGGASAPGDQVWLALIHAATEKPPRTEPRRCLDKARATALKRDEKFWDAVLLEVLIAEARRAVKGAEDL